MAVDSRPHPRLVAAAARLERAAVGAVEGIARHWLRIAITAIVLFLGLAFAAPVLSMTGHPRLAGGVYLLYRVSCHQLPHRSWFLGGSAATHDWEEVRAFYDLAPEDLWLTFHRPIRDPSLGYQVALCQRDVALYVGLLAGLACYGAARRRGRVESLPLRYYLAAAAAVGADGLTQLLGFRESTPLLRTLTGAAFGLATAWLVAPQIDLGFAPAEQRSATGERSSPGGQKTSEGGPPGPPGEDLVARRGDDAAAGD